jgi:hypothetical protein
MMDQGVSYEAIEGLKDQGASGGSGSNKISSGYY